MLRKPATLANILQAAHSWSYKVTHSAKEMGHNGRGDRRSRARIRGGSHLIEVSLASAVPASDFSGLVVIILHNDTIKVLHNQQPERIRLSESDCPEKGQAYGHKAKKAASALVFGKDVRL